MQEFSNPAKVDKPKLKVPVRITRRPSKCVAGRGKRRPNGNLPYLRFRRKLRKEMF